MNHTLSSARAMDGLTELLTAPIQPWDAVICTSMASREVIEKLFARQEEYLAKRLGASFRQAAASRDSARGRLRLSSGTFQA